MADGLSDQELKIIRDTLDRFSEIDKAILFGSRASGRHKKGSDVDIALMGPSVNEKTVYKVKDLLNEETPMPYFFDVILFSSIRNERLKRQILEEGREI